MAGLRLKKTKYSLMTESLQYLGHVIDSKGLHQIAEKVTAIREAPTPKNVTQLKAYLGLITYYGRFIPNLSHVLFPLYRLLRRDNHWRWTEKENKAFQDSKDILVSSKLLVHFNPNLELTLACDGSPNGIGAVLAHRYPDGTEKPIGYASQTLTPPKKNYSQLECEGLACVFGVTKFHEYLYGRPFTLLTDNLPLKSLFNENHGILQHASSRIQRWALKLASYEYTISFRPTHKHGNADALSRLPIKDPEGKTKTCPQNWSSRWKQWTRCLLQQRIFGNGPTQTRFLLAYTVIPKKVGLQTYRKP